jgi:tRNA A37 threonylcarbamoyladenosine synthetase subunit TsaC/SUA5/YrdC
VTKKEQHISPEGYLAAGRIGHLHRKEDRKKALDMVEKGGTIQMIIGNSEAGVGGIFFDLNNPEAVEQVIRIKSTPEKSRQALFAVMTPDDDFIEIADLDLDKASNLLKLAIFWRVPVKDVSLFPEHAKAMNTSGEMYIQAFPSDRVPFFSRLVREARDRGIRLGGTSLNYTGRGNITEIEEVKKFFMDSGENNFWLNSGANLTGTSYTIVEVGVSNTGLSLAREGNVKFDRIRKQLGRGG